MRILIISTLKRKVAVSEFASRSRIIYQLAIGLVKKGHNVTVLGTGDSNIPGVEIIPVIEKGWVDLPPTENEFMRTTSILLKLVKKIKQIQRDFDIIHNHTFPDLFPLVLEDQLRIPMITTLHAVAADYLDDVLYEYSKTYFIALSRAYVRQIKKGKIYKVIYNGVDTDLYSFSERKEDYLLWMGRLNSSKNNDGSYMDPKGVRWAIQFAKTTGSKLKLIGNVEARKAFETDVKPHLSASIEWISNISPEQSLPVEKIVELMQHAKAFLMTVNQEEPFGLVMAEAQSCGTPVIGFDRGSVSEVVVNNKTGFVVDPKKGLQGLEEALGKISIIQPVDCRAHVEKHFSLDRMVDEYEKVYEELARKQT